MTDPMQIAVALSLVHQNSCSARPPPDVAATDPTHDVAGATAAATVAGRAVAAGAADAVSARPAVAAIATSTAVTPRNLNPFILSLHCSAPLRSMDSRTCCNIP